MTWSIVIVVASIFWILITSVPPPIDQRILLFEAFLREQGIEVEESVVPGDPGSTALLLRDDRDPAQADALLRWVRDGGRLIVMDPASPTLAATGATPSGVVGPLGTTTLEPGCVSPETDGVSDIEAAGYDWTLSATDPASTGCFPKGRGSYLLRVPRGEGLLLGIGGSSAIENDLMLQPGNTRFALRLVGDTDRLTLLPPVPPGAKRSGFWDSLPSPIRALLFELLIAFVVFAVVRGRRFGRIPGEAPRIPISASELIRARAGLYRNARARGHGAAAVRRATTRRIASRVGGRPDDAPEDLAERVAAATDIPADQARMALTAPDPSTDVELATLERELEDIARSTEGGP